MTVESSDAQTYLAGQKTSACPNETQVPNNFM